MIAYPTGQMIWAPDSFILQKHLKSARIRWSHLLGEKVTHSKLTTGCLTCMVISKLEGSPSSPLMNISLEASTKKTRLSLPVTL